jgi:uncharacterized protein YegL
MPRISGGGDSEMQSHRIGGSSFSFQGARIDSLGATEYTLVTVAVDVTGSTASFAADLHKMLVTAVEACKKSPRSDNLLLRVITFSTYVGGVAELHGFTPLAQIDPSTYPAFQPDGMTPLHDATFSAVGALVEYGEKLMESDFLANGIVFVITDGDDNRSSATPRMIKEKITEATKGEKLESLVTVLIGINAAQYQRELERFRQDAGIDQYIDAGEATKGKLAKLAAFVSQSVSSQSQALGTGGPSQNIAPTI